MDSESTKRLLNLLAYHECSDDIWWKETGSEDFPEPLINVNDCFFWACADAEEITAPDLDALQKALEDVGDNGHGLLLFVCRKRRMRPQGALYKHLDSSIQGLFNDCGPERKAGMGNPVAAPSP